VSLKCFTPQTKTIEQKRGNKVDNPQKKKLVAELLVLVFSVV